VTREFGSLGGRDDVYLPGELPDLGRWRITDVAYLEANEVSPAGQFPQHGVFMLVELVETGEEIYVAFTEGLEELVATKLEETGETLVGMTVDVDTAEKVEGEGEKFGSWRYTASVVPESRLGPPADDDENGSESA
jgi:hypothetical protein